MPGCQSSVESKSAFLRIWNREAENVNDRTLPAPPDRFFFLARGVETHLYLNVRLVFVHRAARRVYAQTNYSSDKNIAGCHWLNIRCNNSRTVQIAFLRTANGDGFFTLFERHRRRRDYHSSADRRRCQRTSRPCHARCVHANGLILTFSECGAGREQKQAAERDYSLTHYPIPLIRQHNPSGNSNGTRDIEISHC